MGAFRVGASRLAFVASVAATTLAAPPAGAQSRQGNQTLAVTLFQRGRQLMQQKRYPEACPLFADSYRLDPSGGTLVNLALCHELEGRTATAEAEYQDLIGHSRHQNRADRVRFAEERLAAIAPKVPHWTIALGPNQQLPGIEVLHDGQPVPPALWGTSVPIDPNAHEIEVRATNHKPWRASFTVGPGELAKVVVPALVPVQTQPAPPPPEEPSAPPPVVIIEAPREPAPVPTEPPPRPRGPDAARTVAGALFGGIGVVGLGLGTYFGLTAFGYRDDVDRVCRDSCNGGDREDASEYNREGKLNAHLSTASFGVGVIGLGLGAYFLFIAPSSPAAVAKAGASVKVVPHLGAGSAGLSLAGAW